MKKQIYVTTTDKFMSGWGAADKLINKLVFLCDSWEDAEIVKDNAECRTDQKNINICFSKPPYVLLTNIKKEILDYVYGNYYVQIKTKQDYSQWYEKDYFYKRARNL